MENERKIYLAWQANPHQRRYVVGELIETASKQYIFRYSKGNDLQEAQKLGFDGYPAFPLSDNDYQSNVIETFGARLPPRSREDFKKHLREYWEVKDLNVSDFDILAVTGGRMPTDRFEFIDPHGRDYPETFLTDLAGVIHHAKPGDLPGLIKGALLKLEREPSNKFDPYAVKVLYQDQQIGYIKRVLSETIFKAMENGRMVSAEVKDADINGVVNSILVRITIK